MTTPLDKLLTDIEQVAEYYKLQGHVDVYADLKIALDAYYTAIETPCYDFEKPWSQVDRKTKDRFWRKVKQIEPDAIKRIATEDNVSYKQIRPLITPLDPEAEWASLYGGSELPHDYNWIEFEMQFMREELREKMVEYL